MALRIKTIKNIKDLRGKRVFLRSDFNIPITRGIIKDDFRIIAALPTIRYLMAKKSKIIIATHLGDPGGKKNNKHTVKPLARRLSEVLGVKVVFVSDCIGKTTEKAANKLRDGEILLLENLRFYPGEEENSSDFARSLAKLADIYVNNAFGVSHREHASVSAIKKLIPAYAGLLLENEVLNLHKIYKPKKPLIAVIGGAKIKTKISLLKKLKNSSQYILVGGALANNFIKAKGFPVGRSLVSPEEIKLAKILLSKNIVIPIDVIVSDKMNDKGVAQIRYINNIKKKDIILDIGPETIKRFSALIKKAKTIIWNGPMGVYEYNHFKHGTLSIARVIATRSKGFAFGAVGGGETIDALKMTKMMDYVDWVSTGGGAMLAFLGGEKMPGLKDLIK